MKRAFIAAHLYVGPRLDGGELLSVAKNPPTNGRNLYASQGCIGPRDGYQLVDATHPGNIGKITGIVNGEAVILPDGYRFSAGYITGMDLKGILRRVERRLRASGMSADAASKRAGKPDAIRNLKRAVRDGGDSGRRGISTATVQALARALETPERWLLTEEGPESSKEASIDAHQEVVSAPLISLVQAGNVRKPDHVERFEEAPRVYAHGLDPKGEWIALRVEGDSMDRISPPDSVIFVNVRDRKLVPNACYVIQDEHGGASYKRYRDNRWEAVSAHGQYKPYIVKGGRGPRIIGRVRKTTLDM